MPRDSRVFPNGWVRVFKGAATTPVVSYRFVSAGVPSVVPGGVGLAASRARSVFDDVRIWEDSALAR